ncbi:MAG: hypothetical protein FRX49_02041 [Trebouxia sp. A1-2]|nr:MAG: hypothetical protein FRX49_02041 [Trebouxia sp. A1-2]
MAHLQNQTGLTEMFEDSLGLSEGLTVLQLENSYNALLVALDADQDEELLPPEGFISAGPITPEGAPVDNAAELSAADRALLIQPPGLTSAKELLRIATTLQQPAAAPLPAGAVMTAPSDGLGDDRPEGQAAASWGSKSFLLVWADTAEPVRLTPSVLLAHLILCSRREAGMFLRMASGLGYCQVGDYVASLFFLFRRRGHRLKCWECGVKKKAPCGQTQRDDLPWCCHRRLGEWIALHTVTRADNAQKSITFQSNGTFFLSLLPPKKVLDASEPVAAQLQFQPQAAEVVRLSEIMKERPFHPSMTLQKALTRLAPTCRKLWNQMDWITDTVAQVVGERSEPAAAKLHLWLERTAFYKVPKSHQDEVSEQCQKPFEQLIDELLPVVAGAPNLGGHNRSGESMKATRAKQKKMQQTQPGSDAPTAAALARRAGSFSGNVAQVPNAGALQTSMGLPQGAAWDQAPLLVRVGESESGQQPANLPYPAAEHPADVISQGIDSAPQLSTTPFPSGTTPGSAEGGAVPLGMEGWGQGHMPGVYGVAERVAGNGNIGQQPAAAELADGAQTDTPVTREYTINGKRKPLTNTGQGRRRLNARAALRAAGQDRQPQAAPLASPPQVANPIVAVRNPSLDTESSGGRKSKAMAGAYSSTYSKLQAQGQLLHPSMQLAMAEAEADRAAAEADPAAFFKQRAVGPNNLGVPSRGPVEDASMAMQSTLLDAPHLLQGKQLRLGKKSKRGARDGNDTESADEQTGSPLHVLSDIAQREGELEARPEAAANGADSELSPRMQTRSGDSAAAGQAIQNSPRHRLQQMSNSEELQALKGQALQAAPEAAAAACSLGQGVVGVQEQMPTALAAALPAAPGGGSGTRHSKRQALAKADSPRSDSTAPARDTEDTSSPKQAIGGDVPRRKRERTSRLGRKAGHKPKVDRFHYLFEAIEADKASDSETAHGTGSRLSEGAEQDSAQATSKQVDQDNNAQAQAEPHDPDAVQSQEAHPDTASGADRPAGNAKQPAVGAAGDQAMLAADQAAQLQSDAAQTVAAGIQRFADISLLSSGQSSWPGTLHQSLVPLSVPHTSAQANAQPLQGYAQQPQGQVYQMPGMGRHLQPIRSSHLLQQYPTQLQSLPQTLAQQQQQAMQMATGAAMPQHPGMAPVDPNIPTFFQPHMGPTGNEQGLLRPALGAFGAAQYHGFLPGQFPYAQPMPYGYPTIPVSYAMPASAAAISSLPEASTPLLLATAAPPLHSGSTAVRPTTSDAATGSGAHTSDTASQSGALLQPGVQDAAPLQTGIGVSPQYCGGMQQQAGMMPDYQMGFGYLVTAPQLPQGLVYQQMPAEAPASAPSSAGSDAQPALPSTTSQAGRSASHTATDQQASSVDDAATRYPPLASATIQVGDSQHQAGLQAPRGVQPAQLE